MGREIEGERRRGEEGVKEVREIEEGERVERQKERDGK